MRKYGICFAHDNMKKLPSKLGYFINIKEIVPNGPNFYLNCKDLPLPFYLLWGL